MNLNDTQTAFKSLIKLHTETKILVNKLSTSDEEVVEMNTNIENSLNNLTQLYKKYTYNHYKKSITEHTTTVTCWKDTLDILMKTNSSKRIIGIVGGIGAGKSTLALSILLHLTDPKTKYTHDELIRLDKLGKSVYSVDEFDILETDETIVYIREKDIILIKLLLKFINIMNNPKSTIPQKEEVSLEFQNHITDEKSNRLLKAMRNPKLKTIIVDQPTFSDLPFTRANDQLHNLNCLYNVEYNIMNLMNYINKSEWTLNLLYLKVNTDTLMQNIKTRSREGEDKYKRSYISLLNKEMHNLFGIGEYID